MRSTPVNWTTAANTRMKYVKLHISRRMVWLWSHSSKLFRIEYDRLQCSNVDVIFRISFDFWVVCVDWRENAHWICSPKDMWPWVSCFDWWWCMDIGCTYKRAYTHNRSCVVRSVSMYVRPETMCVMRCCCCCCCTRDVPHTHAHIQASSSSSTPSESTVARHERWATRPNGPNGNERVAGCMWAVSTIWIQYTTYYGSVCFGGPYITRFFKSNTDNFFSVRCVCVQINEIASIYRGP